MFHDSYAEIPMQTARNCKRFLRHNDVLLIATAVHVKLVANMIYNFKNTYCGNDVTIQNKTNTDNKYKTLAGESLHVSSWDFELICLSLYYLSSADIYKSNTLCFTSRNTARKMCA